MDIKKLKDSVKKLLKGDLLSLSKLITLVENREENADMLIAELFEHTGKAHILGITGPPGAGKSSITDKLVHIARKKGKKIAVICVDPSSPFSGGAILGDRIRMQEHTKDPNVFIRSLATRGNQGGLSRSTQEVIILLDAAGFDLIILETAGVGQTELAVLGIAHTTVVVLVPESGDDIQMMKAGILEIAEILAVNKCDRMGADIVLKELQMSLHLSQIDSKGKEKWDIPVLKTSSEENKGMEELYENIYKHKEFLLNSRTILSKRKFFAKKAIINIATDNLAQDIELKFKKAFGEELLLDVMNRKLDPFSAVKKLS